MDVERTMAFILEQQAKFEVDIQEINQSLKELKETSTRHAEAIKGLTETSMRHDEAIGGLLEAARLQAARSDRLEQGLVSIAEAHNRLADTVAEGRREFDQRLNDFIAQVSRYIASHNGG